MTTRIFCVFSLLLTAVLCSAQTSSASSGIPQEIPVFDVNAIDKTVDPCVDFYQYSCGTWMKNNPIPPDKSRWGRFDELAERNLYILRDILTEAQAPGKHSAIGDHGGYLLWLVHGRERDREKRDCSADAGTGADSAASRPKRILFGRLLPCTATRRRRCLLSTPQPDMHDSTETIAYLDQGGITLPDRDYYIKDDPKSVETRQKYVEHVQKMFELAGDKPEVAAAEAKTVLTVETGLAQASMDRTVRRDPKTRDHKMTVAEIAGLAPNFDLTLYFADNGSPKFTSLNVSNPDFFKQVNEQLNAVPLEDWKVYLRWKTINEYAPLLTKAFVEEDFTVQRQVHVGTEGDGAALEALRESYRREPGHGFGQALCRSHLRRRRQRAHFEDGAGDRECDASGHWPVDLDVGHDQEEGL